MHPHLQYAVVLPPFGNWVPACFVENRSKDKHWVYVMRRTNATKKSTHSQNDLRSITTQLQTASEEPDQLKDLSST